ncbi:MAG TPA: M14 family metallopeptidase [Flavobacterium sp.]|nr:M14 family metallopeptidase [Flavobacterium sp.]
MKQLYFLLLICVSMSAQKDNKYLTVFEKGNGNQSATYQQTIDYYKALANNFPTIKIEEMGMDDSGEPIHIVIFNPDKNFDFDEIHKTKSVLLINNGIHPGEPDGIDATMMFFRDLALGKIKAPQHTVLVAIPVYNIGGALNRNSTSRVNQDGPEEYGFRGNARNYDLNRDCIKSDTKNTKSFVAIYHLANPEVFIDNHVSDGADYQYVLTYIMTEHNKLGPDLGDYMNKEMTPTLVANLKKKKIESTPYVNAWGATPDKGFAQFVDSPRYTTGYTSLFNTIGFVVETHMLKKYPARVKATYDFMLEMMNYTDANYKKIKDIRLLNERNYRPGNQYAIQWQVDSSKVETLPFLGFEGIYKKSDATTGQRLFYDRTKPYNKNIPFYKEYKAVKEVTIPSAYVIPKGFWDVIDLLKSNNIQYTQFKKDTVIDVESYKIADYKTTPNAYEGHYLHKNTRVTSQKVKVAFAKGDCLFSTQQKGVKYLLETLEPEGIDSFFNWNFFDTTLQQKEGYSDYVFEDLATQILKENPETKAKLDEKIKTDKVFAGNPEAQLDWIYKQSIYYEKAHLQYPVYRIMK